MVEPQSLGGREIRFRVVDAALGEQRRGSVPLASLRATRPSEFLPQEAIKVE